MNPQFVQSLKVLAGALMAAPVVIAVAIYFTIMPGPTVSEGMAPGLAALIVAALAVAAHIGATVAEKRIEPLPIATPAEEVGNKSFARLQTSTVLAFALCDVPLIAAIALTFITGSYSVFLVGFVLGEALLAYHVWPSRSRLMRVEERLDASGVRSRLTERFISPGQ